MEQVHLYKGEVAVMAGWVIDVRSQDYAENEMLGVVNVLRRQTYKHTFIALLTTTLIKLDQDVISNRLEDQSEQFKAIFGSIVDQLETV